MTKPELKTEVLNRLKNIRGHITGIERMVEEDHSCADIMVQLSAIRAAIEKTGIYILENNALECLTGELTTNPVEKQKFARIVRQMLSFLK